MALLGIGVSALAIVSFGGCGFGESSQPAPLSASRKPVVCKAGEQLARSVTALMDHPLLTSFSKGEIQVAVDGAANDLSALTNASRGRYGSQIKPVKEALDELQARVGSLTDESPIDDRASSTAARPSPRAKVAGAITKVAAFSGALLGDLDNDCHST
jgi:hypothetical protein